MREGSTFGTLGKSESFMSNTLTKANTSSSVVGSLMTQGNSALAQFVQEGTLRSRLTFFRRQCTQVVIRRMIWVLACGFVAREGGV